MRPLSILLVDDEESIRTLLQMILEQDGNSVTPASSGKIALQALAANSFDLLITDIMMPDMDGIEIISAARKRCPGLRILAISGGGSVMASDDCLKMARMIGAHVILPKPFDDAQLRAAINQAVPNPADP